MFFTRSDNIEMDRRGHRLVLPEDGYEWKKYGQKFIKSIRKFRSYFKCQESSCMAKKRAEWCTSDPTNVRIVYDGVHSHTHHGSSSSSADQPKRESPKDESPSEKAKKEYSKLPSNPEEVEDLRRDSAANPLIAFTYDELRIITANFRQDRVLGGGGFGCVYKGFISEDLREGLQPVPVAVKVHDGDNSYQGHRE